MATPKRDFYIALQQRLSQEVPNVSLKLTKEVAGAVVDTLTSLIHADGEAPLPGIGRFHVRETKPRLATNPITGEKIHVPAGRKLSFRPEHGLKGEIKSGAPAEAAANG